MQSSLPTPKLAILQLAFPVLPILSVVLIAVTASNSVHAATLRSPWTEKPVTETKSPFPCLNLAPIPADLTMEGFYRLDDPTHSQIDPVRQAAYTAAAAPVKDDASKIVSEADAYRTTGSHRAAFCVIQQIYSLAQQHSMTGHMSSNQASYVQGWVAGAIAIAWLKVQGSGIPSATQRTAVADWLLAIGKQTRAYYEAHLGKGDAANNHLYWAGLELAAIGVTAQNQDDFDWGLNAYTLGVQAIQPDGTLPREMERAGRALHYHLYALAPLVLLAEFGEANGLDLYAQSNGAIHRLESISVQGLKDPSLFEKTSGTRQEVHLPPTDDAIAWAPPYQRRFPNPLLKQFINESPNLSSLYLGGLAPP
jgi:poly(beta-D-mannuronate) lyase